MIFYLRLQISAKTKQKSDSYPPNGFDNWFVRKTGLAPQKCGLEEFNCCNKSSTNLYPKECDTYVWIQHPNKFMSVFLACVYFMTHFKNGKLSNVARQFIHFRRVLRRALPPKQSILKSHPLKRERPPFVLCKKDKCGNSGGGSPLLQSIMKYAKT